MGQGVTFNGNQGPITVTNESRVIRSSILGKLIEIIASSEMEAMDLKREPAEIEEKIKFNDLKTHRWLVQNYIENSVLIDSSIFQLNQMINNGSTKLKRQMKLFYRQSLTELGVCTDPLDLDAIKKHSDNIVKRVILLASNFVRASADLQHGYYDEDIDFGISLIASYSIIECIVLENPNDHDRL